MAMNLECNLIVISLTTVFSLITCQSLISYRYVSVKAADGSPLCTTEQPSKVVAMSANPVRCGTECTQSTTCTMHQMNEENKQCQLFNYSPKNYTKVNKCKAYYAVGDVDVKNAPITNATCSFPFTSQGQLYFSCAQIIPSLYDLWCLNIVRGSEYNHQRHHTCIEQCGNTDIIIPVLNTSVPVRSVHQWIIILSHIDSNFPQSQTYQKYQDGFGDPTSNFWLGLTRVYYLTNSAVNGGHTYRLRFELLGKSNSLWFSMEYDWFYLESLANNFTFRASASSAGDTNDAVNQVGTGPPVNGSPFVTSSTPCVTTYRYGPGWYPEPTKCGFASMFGSFSGLGWGNLGSLRSARMMIRLIS